MCGITGYWDRARVDATIVERMAFQIMTRGPDDSGVWVDECTGVALAHRRLSILDLSSAGHQPMHSPCERYVLVYNGEIYNHLDLRAALEAAGGHFDWRGHSDTETLLAALRHWGVEGTLQRVNGMFAFALWDKSEQQLFLARDRMGEKPLYYGHSGKVFLFGSELKALKVHPKWRGEVNRDALTLYLRHNYVPAPWSIYQGIKKLPPAHYVIVTESGAAVSEPLRYWDLGAIAESGSAKVGGDAVELTDELDALLGDAVKLRMATDVPLGAFLSGGIDSTTVVALMQAQSNRAVKTFSIGFHEEGYNEAEHARAVATHLGTDHTELYISSGEAMAVIPKLPRIWDEPFSDSSQIPTYLVSQLARRHVTVSLSGDGGDELFFGYSRYLKGRLFERLLGDVPCGLRRMLALGLSKAPVKALDWMGDRFPGTMRVSNLGDRTRKLSGVIEGNSGAFYQRLISHWKLPEKLVRGGTEPATLLSEPDRWPTLPSLQERMMYLDLMTYLPDDILTKLDRASMSVSLEARVPLLDHRVVEFAWRVPTSLKYCGGQGKWLLRQVLLRYVPPGLMNRPKMGFGVPIEHWLRGPLREWAEELIDEKKLADQGFFDPAPIRKMWVEHISGERRWQYYLWDILMFQAWLEETHVPG